MKETDIVQALRCFAEGECKDCAMHEDKQRCQENLLDKAADLIERLTAENAKAEAERDALREKPRWIPVAERMPEERVLVNVVWVNRAPEPYYERIKNVPFSGTACFYREKWYWDSPVVLDLLAEYGKDAFDLVDEAVEITHWMPLPDAQEEGGKA